MTSTKSRAERAQLTFVAHFLRPRQLSDLSDYWNQVLGTNVADAVDRFVKQGLLVPASLATKLEFKYTVAELKPFLKAKGLSQSGRKADLIARLINHDCSSLKERAQKWRIYECSELGHTVATEFEAALAAEKKQAEHDTISYLKNGDFRNASLTVAEFASKQVFWQGMAVERQSFSPASKIQNLEIIFSSWPLLLAGIPEDLVMPLRIGAAMIELFGEYHPGDPCPVEPIQGTHLNAIAAMRMICFHAIHKISITEYQQMGATRVRILGGDDEESCPQCTALNGKSFPIESAPELPHATCTSECGCRCMAMIAKFGTGRGLFSDAIAYVLENS
jgi:hypothetical protein